MGVLLLRVLLFLALCIWGLLAFNPIMDNSKMRYIFQASAQAVTGGPLYPKDSTGKVLTQYWADTQFTPWVENVTGRSLAPLNLLDVQLLNTGPNISTLLWNFSAPYSTGYGMDNFQVTENGINVTQFNHTLIGQGGLKIGVVIHNDSNIYNTTTAKYFVSYPFPCSTTTQAADKDTLDNFLVTTQYYTVQFNEPTFSDSDGVETTSTIGVVNMTNTTIVFVATYFWHSDFIFDPEVSILITTSNIAGGDGGGNDDILAFIALTALVIAPVVVVVVVLVGLAISWYYKRSHGNPLSKISSLDKELAIIDTIPN